MLLIVRIGLVEGNISLCFDSLIGTVGSGLFKLEIVLVDEFDGLSEVLKPDERVQALPLLVIGLA